MDRALISWNLPNWFTVMLMAAAGYVVLAGAAQVFKWNAPTAASGGSY
jgi:hypothetical protein